MGFQHAGTNLMPGDGFARYVCLGYFLAARRWRWPVTGQEKKLTNWVSLLCLSSAVTECPTSQIARLIKEIIIPIKSKWIKLCCFEKRKLHHLLFFYSRNCCIKFICICIKQRKNDGRIITPNCRNCRINLAHWGRNKLPWRCYASCMKVNATQIYIMYSDRP